MNFDTMLAEPFYQLMRQQDHEPAPYWPSGHPVVGNWVNRLMIPRLTTEPTEAYTKPGWLRFDPDFVYRHRPVQKTVSTANLVEALVTMTKRVDLFADMFSERFPPQ